MGKIKVGQTVKLIGEHPYAGEIGEVVSIDVIMGKPRPRIRLFEMGDHEVYAMRDDEVKVIDG